MAGGGQRGARRALAHPRERARGGNWSALAAFLIGAAHWMHFGLIGQIRASELVLAGLLPFLLLSRGHLLRNRACLTALALALFWLAGQIASDLVRGSEFRDYARGWANIAFLAVEFCALYLLLHGSRRRFVLFALGLAVSGYLAYWLAPNAYTEDYPWKFGLGNSTALLAALLALWRPLARIPALAAAPLLAVGGYSLVVGYRSLFGVALLAALYLLAQALLARRWRRARVVWFSPSYAGFGIAIALVGVASLHIYDFAARQGYLDARSTMVHELQARGTPLGIFPSARPTIFAAGPAILDSPIIGQGSWAKNPDYANRIFDASRYGYQPAIAHTTLATGLIPSHSRLLGSWMQAGALAVPFWVWSLLLIFAVLGHPYLGREPLTPLIAYIGINEAWHVLFSPVGGELRLFTAYALALLVVAWRTLRARGRRAPGG